MNKRIIVVDDEKLIHDDFRKTLCPPSSAPKMDQAEEVIFGKSINPVLTMGYELTSAFQGEEAIRLVREAFDAGRPFAMAFVDIRMPPGLDGVQTAEQLWTIDPDLQIVICTAYSDYTWQRLRERLHLADKLLILKKPFDSVEVLQIASAMTRKHELEHDARLQMGVLRRSNALLVAQQESSIDGILVVDENRRILAMNRRFGELWNVPESLSKGTDDDPVLAHVLHQLKDPQGFLERVTFLYQHPDEFSRDEIHLRDGRVFDRVSSPVISEDRQNLGRIWFFRDITREKESAEALRQAVINADSASRAKSDFLANMSHEIRTPLTAILGFTDMILDPRIGESDRLSFGQTIRRNSEHLLSIINDILDVSKIEAGQMSVESIDCSPHQIMASVLSLLLPRAIDRGLSLKLDYQTPIPELIKSDPTRLRQILTNLIGNAIKFTHVGEVRIVASFDASTRNLKIDIIDSGVGMTPEAMTRLFKPFSQADTSTTRKFGGSGLGLVISRTLATMLGGEITVNSIPSKGSTFTLTLPSRITQVGRLIYSPHENPTQERQPAQVEATAPRPVLKFLDGIRILLAEDGIDNRVLIEFILKNVGAVVDTVENGQLAAEQAMAQQRAGNPYDVILMDMQMPILDGYGATSLLRTRGYTGPIVALTANVMAGDRAKCLTAGCDEHVSKPINRAELIRVITLFCGER